MYHKLTVFVLISILLLVAAFGGSALGQDEESLQDLPEALTKAIDPSSDISPALLALDYRQCFDGCRAVGHPEADCQALCVCSIREMQKRYANKSYIALRAQMSRDRIDEANRVQLDSIGRSCADAAVKAGFFGGQAASSADQQSKTAPVEDKPQ